MLEWKCKYFYFFITQRVMKSTIYTFDNLCNTNTIPNLSIKPQSPPLMQSFFVFYILLLINLQQLQRQLTQLERPCTIHKNFLLPFILKKVKIYLLKKKIWMIL
ncbi:hypothetical protein 3TG000146 [Iridovirus CN01]|nr:hypothetical protein 4TH000070 [Iridovirus CN01]UPA43579.1 hypothetical protein 3TG000146 [Iridovirus CN01]UPA43614.1 hypothetical protein 1DG000022 [Iridovirus CN01]UPA43776.1 hypothetical protein L2A02_0022 [Iridovirus CN01]